MGEFFTRLRQRNPEIQDHDRFLDRADNLVLALVGIPTALAFGRLVLSWTANAILAKYWLQWIITVVAVVVLFNLLAIMFGLFTFVIVYWKSYRQVKTKDHVSILAYPLLLVAIGSVIVMGMVAGSENMATGMSVQVTLTMAGFGIALCLFMISLEGLTILLLPDILPCSDVTHVETTEGSPVEALIAITYALVFVGLLLARLMPTVVPMWLQL